MKKESLMRTSKVAKINSRTAVVSKTKSGAGANRARTKGPTTQNALQYTHTNYVIMGGNEMASILGARSSDRSH